MDECHTVRAWCEATRAMWWSLTAFSVGFLLSRTCWCNRKYANSCQTSIVSSIMSDMTWYIRKDELQQYIKYHKMTERRRSDLVMFRRYERMLRLPSFSSPWQPRMITGRYDKRQCFIYHFGRERSQDLGCRARRESQKMPQIKSTDGPRNDPTRFLRTRSSLTSMLSSSWNPP